MIAPPLGPTGRDRARFQMIAMAGVALAIVLFSVIATQVTAAHFDDDPALGPQWGAGLYPPFQWLVWSFRFYSAGAVFFGWLYIVFIGVVCAAMLTAVVAIAIKTRSARVYADVHGSAKFLRTVDELRAAGVLSSKKAEKAGGQTGPYLAGCADKNGRIHYIRAAGNEHIGVIAPTRTGKGVGPVNMTALSHPAAFIAFDPKGELFNVSAGYRRTLGPVWRWNPLGRENGSRFNFLDTVRLHDLSAVGDAMDLASLLVDPSSVGDWDHWKGTGFDFLAGLILHVLYERFDANHPERRASLADVARALGDPDRTNTALYEQMAANTWGQCREDGTWVDGVRNDKVAQAGQAMLNRENRERSSVHSTAANCLNLYQDPIVAANTSNSDFRIADIFNGARPGSLYITVSPSKELKLQPMLRMILGLILRTLQEPELQFVNGQPVMPWQHRTLMLLDEFASLGMVKEVELALSRIAGYGVQLMLVIQDNNQLFSSYTQYQTILGGLQTKAVFAPNDQASATWLSDSLGTATVITKDITVSGNRFGGTLNQVSETYREHSRPLMTPDECKRLRPPKKDTTGKIIEGGDVILLRTGLNPIFARQILYFQDPYFAQKAGIPAPADLGQAHRPSAGAPAAPEVVA